MTLEVLPIPAPAQFERALALPAQSRWLGLYWEPQLGYPCYTDGQTVGTVNLQGWQLFCQHPEIQPRLLSYQLTAGERAPRHGLLFDRQHRRLYVGELERIQEYLQHPVALEILEPLTPRHRFSLKEGWQFLREKWLVGLALVLSAIVGVGVVRTAGEYVHEVFEEVFDD
ncbi:hypothetical protein MZ909_12495 [Thermosynechococcus sp. B0]|uniref:hypothetical protein n=1 Tax=unclassified Thermosynechococcus TaxID=2622553 RepID=UPI00122E6D7B|nr:MULTISPECIES: hypothetical protein [unclassified Thermosynechococcus]QEQ02110.1 hypothetical protein FFX45_12455 [Thermosynechococcus sp. CL-1]WJI24001.1 hypothetical protein MZ909_12495 [Thermosynechococcus sp. B0]WJI26515.1 hypothetical protein M0644_12530 [Thermosynechococcus sp. B1]WJI29041.1 hypothetical protein M0646_12535 [Thermosynechococcus sp. B3]